MQYVFCGLEAAENACLISNSTCPLSCLHKNTLPTQTTEEEALGSLHTACEISTPLDSIFCSSDKPNFGARVC